MADWAWSSTSLWKDRDRILPKEVWRHVETTKYTLTGHRWRNHAPRGLRGPGSKGSGARLRQLLAACPPPARGARLALLHRAACAG
eukprot:gene15974-biopygen2210